MTKIIVTLLLAVGLAGCAWRTPVDQRPIPPPVTWEEMQESEEDAP